ncbi:MAG TPA: hypothetical protein VFD78_06100 [Chitinophagaceae bacterium]|nr:hypothetical protein [Chitinophagaceae bacterium]
MRIIKNILSKSLLTLLMLQILNISVYNVHLYDFTPQEILDKKYIKANPINSFAELILEEFAGLKNAIPEQEPQSDQQSANNKHSLNSPHINVHYFNTLDLQAIELELERILHVWCNQYEFDYHNELIQPPTYS